MKRRSEIYSKQAPDLIGAVTARADLCRAMKKRRPEPKTRTVTLNYFHGWLKGFWQDARATDGAV